MMLVRVTCSALSMAQSHTLTWARPRDPASEKRAAAPTCTIPEVTLNTSIAAGRPRTWRRWWTLPQARESVDAIGQLDLRPWPLDTAWPDAFAPLADPCCGCVVNRLHRFFASQKLPAMHYPAQHEKLKKLITRAHLSSAMSVSWLRHLETNTGGTSISSFLLLNPQINL
jgi:hypothetical protein